MLYHLYVLLKVLYENIKAENINSLTFEMSLTLLFNNIYIWHI